MADHTHHENCSCVHRPQLTYRGRAVVLILQKHPHLTVAEAVARFNQIEADVEEAMRLPHTD